MAQIRYHTEQWASHSNKSSCALYLDTLPHRTISFTLITKLSVHGTGYITTQENKTASEYTLHRSVTPQNNQLHSENKTYMDILPHRTISFMLLEQNGQWIMCTQICYITEQSSLQISNKTTNALYINILQQNNEPQIIHSSNKTQCTVHRYITTQDNHIHILRTKQLVNIHCTQICYIIEQSTQQTLNKTASALSVSVREER